MGEAKEQRLTLAGRYVIDGLSFKQALMKAGYSEQTARCSKANGLSVKRCVELALKADGASVPAALRGSARKLFQKKLDAGLDNPDTVSLTAAAKAVETVEKIYAHSDEGDTGPVRSFEDRAKWVFGLFAEMKRRGIEPELPADVIDVESVDE